VNGSTEAKDVNVSRPKRVLKFFLAFRN